MFPVTYASAVQQGLFASATTKDLLLLTAKMDSYSRRHDRLHQSLHNRFTFKSVGAAETARDNWNSELSELQSVKMEIRELSQKVAKELKGN